MNTQTAYDFLTRCFYPGETIAVLLRKENPASTTQRIVRLEQALAPRYLAWLRYENHIGANVYVAANPLLPGSRKRTKECIAEVRHLYIDIDVDGEERIAALRASDAVPVPSTILSTSPGKYQALWKVEGFNFDQQENALKLLVIAFGGDSACTDRNRVLRVPGFRNCKYDPAHTVTVEYPSDSIYHSDDFRLDDASLNAAMPFRDTARTYATGKNTHSEQDWTWAVQQLSLGEDATEIYQNESGFHAALANDGLHALLPLLLFWGVAGLHTAFAMPLSLAAGWIFRVTAVRVSECANAARRWTLWCGVVVTALNAVLVAIAGWSARAVLVQVVCGICLAILLTDCFFFSEEHVPLNRPRMPGRSNFPLLLTLYVAILPLFVMGTMRLEARLESRMTGLVMLAIGTTLVHAGVVRLRREPAVLEEELEGYDDDFQLLGLT